MTRWQRSARLGIGVFAVVFAVFVAREMRRRAPATAVQPAALTDAGAVIETTAGSTTHFSVNREEVAITYEKQFTYADGTSKLQGVTVVFDERKGSRTFTITGKEGRLGKGATSMVLDGAVKMVGSDGMTVLTEHASYADADGVVNAPGPVGDPWPAARTGIGTRGPRRRTSSRSSIRRPSRSP
jgi:hypothetical protein